MSEDPDLNQIINYAEKRSGKSRFEILIMESAEYVDFLNKYEMELLRKNGSYPSKPS